MIYVLIPFIVFVGAVLLVYHFDRYSANRTAYVRITQDDIRSGECGDPVCCPAAVAMCRHFGVPCEADAFGLVVGNRNFSTPRKLRTWLRRFDDGDLVGEIEFAILGANVGKAVAKETQPIAAAIAAPALYNDASSSAPTAAERDVSNSASSII
jgi:hypothetical protein